MCGITGAAPAARCPPDVLERMTSALRRRGPDASGVWRDDQAALGHRRLTVLDPTDNAAQPMVSRDGNVVLTYNGEVYNHQELREDLGGDWRSTGDTETLLRLYKKEGARFLRRLNGMFALALYHRQAGTILIARDRLGIKPLYWYHHDGLFLFASAPSSFLAHPDFPREIDADALHSYFLYNYVPAPQSIFCHTHQVPPGCFVEYSIRTGKLRRGRWWSPAPKEEQAPERSLEEAAEEAGALISDAVRLRTLSDVPLGCFLSGGVDSSLIAAELSGITTKPRTFTVGFREGSYNEIPLARAVAKHLGTDHNEKLFLPGDCLMLLDNVTEVCAGEPFADASLLPSLLLAQTAREDVTVALSGDGGDELFFGYDRYRWAETVAAWHQRVPGGLRRTGAAAAAAAPHYRSRMLGRGLQFRSERDLYGRVFTGWNATFAARLLNRTEDFHRDPIHAPAWRHRNRSLLWRCAYTDIRHYLPGDILTKVDRAGMYHGLEVRVPLLDYRLVEWTLRQPDNVRREKALLRALLARHVPESLFRRPKRGFAVPLAKWFRGPLRSRLEEALAPAELRRHGLLDEATVQHTLRDHMTGRWNHERQLWALFVFQLWHDDLTSR